MRRVLLSIICLFYLSVEATSQDVQFTVEVTTDTLYFGNTFGIKYNIVNAQGDFQPPLFEGFTVVGGPNVSSQFTMINGQISQSASYEYFLSPDDVGLLIIPPAIINQGGDEIFSSQVQMVVLENEKGIRQEIRGYKRTQTVTIEKESKNLSKRDSMLQKLKKVKAKKI